MSKVLKVSARLECIRIPLAGLTRLHDGIGADSLQALLLVYPQATEARHVATADTLSTVWRSTAEAFFTSSESMIFDTISLRLFLHHIGDISALEAATDMSVSIVGIVVEGVSLGYALL